MQTERKYTMEYIEIMSLLCKRLCPVFSEKGPSNVSSISQTLILEIAGNFLTFVWTCQLGVNTHG